MKKGFRILKFKKDNAIFEVQNISKSFDGRPVLNYLSKFFQGNVLGFWVQMVAEKQLFFPCALVNKIPIVEK